MPKHEVPLERYIEVVNYLQHPPSSWEAGSAANHIIDVLGLEVAPPSPAPGETVKDVAMLLRLPHETLLCNDDVRGNRTYAQLRCDFQGAPFWEIVGSEERDYDLSVWLPARVVEYPREG